MRGLPCSQMAVPSPPVSGGGVLTVAKAAPNNVCTDARGQPGSGCCPELRP